jgi:hypothetical protein
VPVQHDEGEDRKRHHHQLRRDRQLAREKLGVDLSPVYADTHLIAAKWLRQLKSSDPNWSQTHPNAGPTP